MKNTHDTYIIKILIGDIGSLCSDGYGILITEEDIIANGKMAKNCCSTVYMKPSPNKLGGDFFKVAHESDLDSTFYTARYRANVKEAHVKKIIRLYHPDAKYLYISDTDDSQSSGEEKYFINIS